jgi:hypothetical protein
MKLKTQFAPSWQILKTSFPNLILSMSFIISLILAFSMLSYGAFYLFVYLKVVNPQNVLFFNISVRLILYLGYLILGALAQILLLNNLLDSKLALGQNLHSIKSYLWQMLALNIIIGIIFFVISSPLYASVLFLAIGNIILAYISTIFGYALIIIVAALLLFSCFILIEKKLNWLNSIKESVKISKNNLMEIIVNLLILGVIFLILNTISILFFQLMFWLAIMGGIVIIFWILFSFAYVFAMYQNYKK